MQTNNSFKFKFSITKREASIRAAKTGCDIKNMNIANLSPPENVKREPAQDLKEYYNSITYAEKSITINNLSIKKQITMIVLV